MKRKCLLWVALLAALFAGAGAGGARAEGPVVYAVLFYSPACGHCHYVITETLPPLQQEYGEQLQILYVDTSQAGAGALLQAACYTLAPNSEHCGYVPTLVIGETLLVGSRDIPEQLPGLVRDGLAAGGIDLPPIPGLRASYEAAAGAQSAAAEDRETEESGAAEPGAAAISTVYAPPTWRDRLAQDWAGNGLAIVVLGVLMAGIGAQAQRGVRLLAARRAPDDSVSRTQWLIALGLAALTTLIAATLALAGGGVSLVTALAALVTVGLIGVTARIAGMRQRGETAFADWLLPVLALLGLVVAGYLAFVEVGGSEAVCGAVGDCNTVQQSAYARLFGVLPIGVLGVGGYLAMLAAWLATRFGGGRLRDGANVALLALALFGTGFSVYLTFLEPFVIGATCAWCLTSAMLMILILSIQAPAGWGALRRWRGSRQ